MGGWIMTFSGEHFPLLEPKAKYVKLVDVAHALSMICRYTGHTIFHYSVAQHCLLGAKQMDDDGHSLRLQTLFMLHDATETWYGDVNKPLKALLGDSYMNLEDKAMCAVWEAFGLKPPTDEEWEIVKYYDDLMFVNEISVLMPNPNEFGVEAKNDIKIEKMQMEQVESLFVNVVISLLVRVVPDEE